MEQTEVVPAAEGDPLPPADPSGEAESSLADHEATFGRGSAPAASTDNEEVDDTPARDRDAGGRFAKHRAQSQRATPEDVTAINELTKDLRTKEQELLALKPDAKAGSPRLVSLRRQIKAIEAELGELKTPVSKPATAATPPAVTTPARPAPVGAFTKREPVMEDFANEPDAYAAWVRALTKFDREKDAWEATQKADADRVAAEEQAAQAAWQQTVTTFQTRMAATGKTIPDFAALTAPVLQRHLPGPLLEAIVRHDKGPEFVYHFAKHPDFLDEMHLLSDGKPASAEFVALLQRRLDKATTQAVNTGSAPGVRPQHIAPRPPNPVRTGPLTTAEDLPSDESSLADHEKAFGRRRR